MEADGSAWLHGLERTAAVYQKLSASGRDAQDTPNTSDDPADLKRRVLYLWYLQAGALEPQHQAKYGMLLCMPILTF